MIPVIQEEVVDKRKLLDTEEFVDALAVSQASPGAMAINMSVYIGHKMKGVPGAIVAVLGSSLPSLIIIMLVSTVFFKYRNIATAEKVFTGVRAAVVAAITYSLVKLLKTVKLNKFEYGVFAVLGFLLVYFGVNPIPVLVLGAFSAIVYDKVKGGEKSD